MRITIIRHILSAGAATIVVLAGGAGAAAAAPAETTCVRFEAAADQGASIWTWGDYDLWVLEAAGEEFSFATPGAGALLQTGNGEDIDGVRKCTVEPLEPVEPVEPVSEPVDEPAAPIGSS